MVSKESDLSTSHSYKEKYRELKRKLKYLVYENECFESDIRKAHATLLQVSREKSFILDQLMSHETVVVSEDSDPDSTDYSSDEIPLPNYPTAGAGTSTSTVTRGNKSLNISSDQHTPTTTSNSIGNHSVSKTNSTTTTKTRGGHSGRKGGRGGRAGGRGGSKTSKTSSKGSPAILNTSHSNNTSKLTPPPPLSLVVSLPRPHPSPNTVLIKNKILAPPPLAAGRKKMKMVTPSGSSSSSSSSSDSDSSDSSESLLIHSKSDSFPPPPLQSITATPIMGGANLLTPTPVQSPPVTLMTPNALTNLALVPSSNLSRLSPASPSLPPPSSSRQHVLLSLGERSVVPTAFQVVTTTSNITHPHHNNR